MATRHADPFALINEEIDGLQTSMGHTYRKYKYQVRIDGDGSILVSQGDWLSKYSMAIHGNPWQVHEFARRDPFGGLQPVEEIDLIYTGETIYHLPSLPTIDFSAVQFAAPSLSAEEKKKAFLRHLANAEKLNPEHLESISKVMGGLDLVNNVAELICVAEELSAVSGVASVAGKVGTVAGAVGLALMPVGFMIDIANAVSAGRRGYANRAVAEATVAWAFDLEKPKPGGHTLDYVKESRPNEVPLWEAAWNDSVEKTYALLEREAIRRVKPHIVTEEDGDFDPKVAYQLALRVAADNDPNELRRMLAEKLDFYGGGPMSQAAKQFER